MMFTSDVSLPKDDTKSMRGKQITTGEFTGLKHIAMLTMLQKKGRGSKAWALSQGK